MNANITPVLRSVAVRVLIVAGIVVLVAVLTACCVSAQVHIQGGKGNTAQPLLTGATALPTAVVSQTQLQPLVILLDTSSSGGKMKARVQAREAMGSLLSSCPVGTLVTVETFGDVPTEIFKGQLSTAHSIEILKRLDDVRYGGHTDLGAAFDVLLGTLPSASAYSVAVISDFWLDALPGSAWAGKSLLDVLQAAHRGGAERLLLIPVGTPDQAALRGLPAWVTVSDSPHLSAWAGGLFMPPPSVVLTHPVTPFWRSASFILATFAVVLMLGGLGSYWRKQQAHRTRAALLEKMTATPVGTEDETAAAPQKESAPKKKVWHLLILETGRLEEIADKLRAGNDALADIWVKDALTTMEIRVVREGAAVSIRNSGSVAVCIGRTRLEPRRSEELPFPHAAEIILALGCTARLYPTEQIVAEEKRHD